MGNCLNIQSNVAAWQVTNNSFQNNFKLSEIFQELFLLAAVFAYHFKDPFVGWCLLIVSLCWKLGLEGMHDMFHENNRDKKMFIWAILSVILAWVAEKIKYELPG